SRTGCCTRATTRASASSSTSTRRASTPTSRRTCRSTGSRTAPSTTGEGSAPRPLLAQHPEHDGVVHAAGPPACLAHPALLDEPGPRRGRDHRGVAGVGREGEPERGGRLEQVAGPQAAPLAAQPPTPGRLVPQHDSQPAPVALPALPAPR